ncbi:MAG: glycoside hydrolase family 127 protein [Acidobacteriota bacterium]
MRPRVGFLALGLLPALASAVTAAPNELPPVPVDAVAPRAPAVARPFDLADVTLGAGPFRDAMERDRAYLLRLDPDRLLHTFRLNVGLPSTARPYGGWESPGVELRGHSAGHYLSACALMYRSTGDPAFKRRVDAMVEGFAACQAAAEDAGYHAGYLSAFPESFIDRVEAGEWVWAPWYTLHKIMAGLLDAHRLAGNTQARDVLVAMADWIAFRVDRLTTEQMQASLDMEFGGMNDLLAGLYALTGDPKHLRLAHAFDHAAVFDPLARGEDPLDGLHANTQIPKVIGAAREYALTGDERYDHIARFFWDRVAEDRSYAIGGNSDREHFFPTRDFARHLGAETAETCNTHNMLKLTRALFAQEPDARYLDFYERGLYNHILASQDPARGMFTYFMPLGPGYSRIYSTPEDSFWCCVGTGMESHAKYGDTIFSHSDDALFVNLFIPATVRWPERGLTLTQATAFPEADTTTLTVDGAAPVDLSLRVRHPAWAEGPLQVSMNGGPSTPLPTAPGSYATLARTWQPGDRVTIKLPLSLRVEPLPGHDEIVALFYGPIALAARLGTDDLGSPYATSQVTQARFPAPDVPLIVTDETDWLRRVEKVGDRPLLFRTRGLVLPHDVTLEPFYTVHHERMAVYWSVLSSDAWAARQRAVADVEADIATARDHAIDRVDIGDLGSETAHALVLGGEGEHTGTISGRTWRQALGNASFGYTLATDGQEDLVLLCVVGARDRHRSFDVWVEGARIEPPELDGQAPGLVRTFSLPIPAELIRNKTAITVRFQPRDEWDATSASLFECLLVPAS